MPLSGIGLWLADSITPTSAPSSAVRCATPGVAQLTASLDVDLGVMISASHNPMPDNDIKLFSRGGHKLPDELEAAIERTVTSGDSDDHRPTGAGVGRVHDLADAADEYLAHLLSTVDRPLSGLTLVVDGAHGAGATMAPEIYRRAGARRCGDAGS